MLVGLVAVFAASVIGLWMSISHFLKPVHVNKEKTRSLVTKALAVHKDKDGAWTPPHVKDPKTGAEPTAVIWRVPTSVFFGLSPEHLGDGAEVHSVKGKQLVVEVHNPAEQRMQKEAFRLDKYTGVILRGGDVYGWATTPLDPGSLPSTLFCVPLTPRAIQPGTVGKMLRAAAAELLNAVDVPGALVPTTVRGQLHALANGTDDNRIASALESVMAADPTSRFVFTGRLYGGGPWRGCLTFEELARKAAPVSGRMQGRFGGRVVMVDEMFGDRKLALASHSKDTLVGCEWRKDGTVAYVRVTPNDVPEEYAVRGAPVA